MRPILMVTALQMLCGAVFGGNIVDAATLDIRPTLITLSPDHPTSVITIGNSEQKPLTYQARLYRWTQRGLEDSLEPTGDLIVSPPMIPIGPGEHRVLRIGIKGPVSKSEETAYRLILDELPSSAEPQSPGTLSVLLRISVPVFVRSTNTPGNPQIAGSLNLSGRLARVSLRNTGSATARVTRARLRVGDVESTVSELRYLLPGGGGALDFNLPRAAAAQAASLELETDQGSATIPLQSRP